MNIQTASAGAAARRCPAFFGGRAPRLSPLAICLSASLLGQACWPLAASATPPTTWQVKNCDDSGPDSLRDIIQNSAQSGDIVDLSRLPTLYCPGASTITLTSGEIVAAQDSLTLQGPSDGTVVISGGGAYRVFHHTGSGTFGISDLTVSDGHYEAATSAWGGCILSDNGNVSLARTTVRDCVLLSDAGFANGGGVGTKTGSIGLLRSTVSGNTATASGNAAFGGGVYSRGLTSAKYSTISNNTAQDASGYYGFGGGVSAYAGASIQGCTIDGNSGAYGSGLGTAKGVTSIANSTFSGNLAFNQSAIAIEQADSATITNSTIVLNQQTSPVGGAVYFGGLQSSSVLTLQSSIIANNSGAGAKDLFFGQGTLTGADNLVMSTNVASPPQGLITVTSDPMLGPLQFNGGFTRTHQLLPGSPALGAGNNNALLLQDQRGSGYPRTTGGTVDMGALQFETIFVGDFDS